MAERKLDRLPPIGIMQGRLSPPLDGRIQAFPRATWQAEFFRARDVGLDCIEWVYEATREADDPLAASERIGEIRAAVETTGVEVSSVCADYYMSVRLIDGAIVDDAAVRHLRLLVTRTAEVGARYVVLPFVDESRLRTSEERQALERLLGALLPFLERSQIELHLETDLEPEELAALLDRLDHPLARANYDIGNSAALKREPDAELPVLARFLGSVHVKDRIPGGATVPLGTGGADLPRAFALIQAAGFNGPYILQVARDVDGDEVEYARRNRQLVRMLLAESP